MLRHRGWRALSGIKVTLAGCWQLCIPGLAVPKPRRDCCNSLLQRPFEEANGEGVSIERGTELPPRPPRRGRRFTPTRQAGKDTRQAGGGGGRLPRCEECHGGRGCRRRPPASATTLMAGTTLRNQDLDTLIKVERKEAAKAQRAYQRRARRHEEMRKCVAEAKAEAAEARRRERLWEERRAAAAQREWTKRWRDEELRMIHILRVKQDLEMSDDEDEKEEAE
ncbi:hypothetical protein GWK47_001394 [Chionoecetes opilio]|uniref:Uncharacterized protein n=1 Tax=Chionoecetes opilio TaxID=41210 RepID=A0A8J4Y1P2_CHIOP|nr:hypothetical protein GWK47_001394 [Chionoecetes opilio]